MNRGKPTHPTRIATRPPRVLVIDDDATVRRLLRRLLRSWGFVVTTVGSAAEGLEAAANAPALILCDLLLPDMDGEALLARLGEVTRGHSKLVVVSGREPRWDEPPAPVVAFVPKPFDMLELVESLKQHLGRGSGPPPPAAAEPTSSTPPPP